MTNYTTSLGTGPIISVGKGERSALALQLTDSDGLPVDLTGCLLQFTVKRSLDDTDARALFTKDSDEDAGLGGITITDAETGSAEIQMEPEDTEGLKSGIYYFDVKFTSSDESVITYPLRLGYLQVTEVVTQQ